LVSIGDRRQETGDRRGEGSKEEKEDKGDKEAIPATSH